MVSSQEVITLHCLQTLLLPSYFMQHGVTRSTYKVSASWQKSSARVATSESTFSRIQDSIASLPAVFLRRNLRSLLLSYSLPLGCVCFILD